MSNVFSKHATGLWPKMGDFLTWIVENQAIAEELLRTDVEAVDAKYGGNSVRLLGVACEGFLDPWIAEFSLPKLPESEVLFVEFCPAYDIWGDEDPSKESSIQISAFTTRSVSGGIRDANAEISDLRSREDGVFLSFNALSPLQYWDSELRVEQRALVSDYRVDLVEEEWADHPPVTVGDLLVAWYDEITWGGRNPSEREDKYETLGKLKRWSGENPAKLIDLLPREPGERAIKLTPMMFEWLASKKESNN